MGKTKNRKRAKMMRLRKKEREALQNTESPGINEIESRLNQQYEGKDIKLRNKSPQIKISNVLLQMIAPLMKNAKSFTEEQSIVGLGVMAWNLGIIKAYKGEAEMLESLNGFGMMLSNNYKSILLEYAEKKSIAYSDYDQLIHDYEFKSINDKNNNLTVAYKSINED
ncbi:MAG: hypothetical protein JEZ09_21570 [Salinivirgaceae bacterium]|nr:hypothetical protein [Salinivirgaceae bacterium]